jgi:hypothetical protein
MFVIIAGMDNPMWTKITSQLQGYYGTEITMGVCIRSWIRWSKRDSSSAGPTSDFEKTTVGQQAS